MLTHFFLGLVITLIVLKKSKSHKLSFTIVLILALLKEGFDSFSLTASFQEATKDVLITIAYPLLAWLAYLLKRKLENA